MHNPAPVLENDSHKLLWDFNIQTDHLIPARRPDLIIINKRKRIYKIDEFVVSTDHTIILKASEKKDKYLDLPREVKKAEEHESNDCANCDWCVRHSNERIIKGPGGLGNWRTGGDYPNDTIVEDGQNTETSPGDLRRLAVIQIPVKNHPLTLM